MLEASDMIALQLAEKGVQAAASPVLNQNYESVALEELVESDFATLTENLKTSYAELQTRVNDLTEALSDSRAARQQELAEKEQLANRLTALVDALPGGVLVLDARAGGPAARAGVRSTTRDESGRLILGDIIIELAGEQIQDSSDLYRTLDKLSVGETVDVTLLRGVDKVSARVTLDDVKDMKPPTASTIVIPMRTKKSPNSPY